MPALPHSAAKASARALLLPSSSPNTMRITVPVWRITPGSAMVALMLATPPITACWPRIGARRSAASTPFCSGITAVSLPTIGLIAAPALSTSHSFTQNSTTSTGPTVFGIVGRLRRHEVRVAARALDFQSLALHGREMRAAGDEGDVGARLGQRRAKGAAHAARSDYRDTHVTLPNTIGPAMQVAAVPSSSSILRPPPSCRSWSCSCSRKAARPAGQ